MIFVEYFNGVSDRLEIVNDRELCQFFGIKPNCVTFLVELNEKKTGACHETAKSSFSIPSFYQKFENIESSYLSPR